MSILPNRPAPEEFSDVIALVDDADSWPELLPPALSLARRESARLRLLILPSADNNSRVDEVRAELQRHDIRTLPAGVQCTPTQDSLHQTLVDTLQDTPRPLLLLRSAAAEANCDTVSIVVASLLSPTTAAEHDSSHTINSELRLFVKRG